MEKKPVEMPDFEVFRTVFYYCFVIIVMPVVSFFGSKFIVFDGLLGLTDVSSNVYAAATAVIILHIALAMFIYRAYLEVPAAAKPAKQD